MTIRSGGRPRDQRPHVRRYDPDAYATDYVPEDYEPNRRYGYEGRKARRRRDGGSGLGGLVRFLIFALLLAGIVMIVALTALRPVVNNAILSWAEDSPAALRLPFVADRGVEPVEHLADQLLGRGVRQETVAARPQEPFERGVLRGIRQDLLEPRVVVEQGVGRLLGQFVELARVHLEPVERLELGRDLLEAKTRPQVELDVRVRRGREQRRHHLVRCHVLAQDEGALLELACQLALAGDEHEGARIADQPFVPEPGGDRGSGVALLHDEFDLGRIRGDGLRQRRAEILADDVGDEREPERRRTVLGPREDRVVDDRPERGEGDDHDD
ncbi:MAG TPA: hypothetical protein VFM38_06280, partial [Candidatus Limnocylindrales bacterium]|nr:hypothetical protein [Candidatus Limnocylindrales bacterium]